MLINNANQEVEIQNTGRRQQVYQKHVTKLFVKLILDALLFENQINFH
jgi:hypothetical protein